MSSNEARSKPWWRLKMSSVMILAVRYRCCSSFSLRFASICSRSWSRRISGISCAPCSEGRDLTEMWRGIALGERRHDRIQLSLPDVHQHVGIGELLQRPGLCSLMRRDEAIWHLSTVVVFEYLLVRDRRHTVVVEFVPSSVLCRLDKSKVVTSVKIARVNEHTVKLVNVGHVRVALVLVDELGQIDLEGELVPVVDLNLEGVAITT